MNFDEMAEKALAKFPFGILAGAEASESELRAAARAAIDAAVEDFNAIGLYSGLYGYGRAAGFEASARRGRRPDCAFRGGNAWKEDLLTLDLSYNGESLARVHIGSIEPRENNL